MVRFDNVFAYFESIQYSICRIAAILKSNDKYFCGGTLISNRKVVTGEIMKDIKYIYTHFYLLFQLPTAWNS